MKRKRALALLCAGLCLLIFGGVASAEVVGDEEIYRLADLSGNVITSRAERIYEGDEYIGGDNLLYRVRSVDDAMRVATAECLGQDPDLVAPRSAETSAIFANASPENVSRSEGGKGLICMYSTHSDESYVPSDGSSSEVEGAGIYDVGDTLKKNLAKRGWEVEYSKQTSLPHDAGAYRRSRQIAEDFVKRQPAVLLDLHRDGIPDPEEYETKVDGEEMTKIRLFVGRSNPNSSVNRSLAKKIKAEADERYPNLIKDIFIGKGDYNQDLYPQSLLLELGTHTSEKPKVEKSTALIAEVLDNVLNASASADARDAEHERQNRAAAPAILWLVGLSVLGALIYGLAATGTLKNWREKLSAGASEISGGLAGKRRNDDAKK